MDCGDFFLGYSSLALMRRLNFKSERLQNNPIKLATIY